MHSYSDSLLPILVPDHQLWTRHCVVLVGKDKQDRLLFSSVEGNAEINQYNVIHAYPEGKGVQRRGGLDFGEGFRRK